MVAQADLGFCCPYMPENVILHGTANMMSGKVIIVLLSPFLRKCLLRKKRMFPFRIQGPVVQSIVSLMSSLRVISLTVLVDSIYNILIFFVEKM